VFENKMQEKTPGRRFLPAMRSALARSQTGRTLQKFTKLNFLIFFIFDNQTFIYFLRHFLPVKILTR
jgi:hypothetical protein